MQKAPRHCFVRQTKGRDHLEWSQVSHLLIFLKTVLQIPQIGGVLHETRTHLMNRGKRSEGALLLAAKREKPNQDRVSNKKQRVGKAIGRRGKINSSLVFQQKRHRQEVEKLVSIGVREGEARPLGVEVALHLLSSAER